jgi:2-oxoglutarate ferredoxin oxidoreductase subunit delta
MAHIVIIRDRCKGCGICIEHCPPNLIRIIEGEINALGYNPASFDDPESKCKACKICAEMCADVCIEVYK